MAKSILELDPTGAMMRHGIDRAAAMEMAQRIINKHGGADVKPESLPAMLDELVANGFGLIEPSPLGGVGVN